MIDYHSKIVEALGSILPTHYEMALTAETETPCISYMELNNAVVNNGNTLGYSRISYQVKVWGNSIAEIQGYALRVDAVMRSLGFTRVSARELYDMQSTMKQKVLTYEALALEEFN
jgi:hypothetical protein